MPKRILVSLLLLLSSVAGHAETAPQPPATFHRGDDTNWYMGVALGSLTYRQSNLPNFSLNDYQLIVGKQLNRVIAAEVHVGTGTDDTRLISGIPTTLSVDSYVAAFLKANLTFSMKDADNKRVRLYGLLGGSRVSSTSSDPATTQSGVQTSVAAGAGLEFFVDNIALQIGFTRYVNASANNHDYTLDSLHVGVIYQFDDRQAGNAR